MIEAEASDRDLVERMLSGQEEAFVEFFDGHFPRLYRFAMARLNQDADAAEEVVQTVMCRAIAKLNHSRRHAIHRDFRRERLGQELRLHVQRHLGLAVVGMRGPGPQTAK